jgi:hypothetical protein
MYPRSDDPDTPDQNELQDDIDTVKIRKPAGQPLVVDPVFTLHANEAEVQTFILGTRPEASGWLGHYLEQTPPELTPPAEDEVRRLGFHKMFVPMTIRLKPSGTGTLQP